MCLCKTHIHTISDGPCMRILEASTLCRRCACWSCLTAPIRLFSLMERSLRLDMTDQVDGSVPVQHAQQHNQQRYMYVHLEYAQKMIRVCLP